MQHFTKEKIVPTVILFVDWYFFPFCLLHLWLVISYIHFTIFTKHLILVINGIWNNILIAVVVIYIKLMIYWFL